MLPAASALASYDSQSVDWRDSTDKVADALVAINPADANAWVQTLRPVGNVLSAALGRIFRDPARLPIERELATNALLSFVGDQPGPLAALLMDAEPRAFLTIFPAASKLDDTVSRLFQEKIPGDAETCQHRGRERPAGRAAGSGRRGPCQVGSWRPGLAPPAAQRRSTTAKLHRQLAKTAGRRGEGHRESTGEGGPAVPASGG